MKMKQIDMSGLSTSCEKCGNVFDPEDQLVAYAFAVEGDDGVWRHCRILKCLACGACQGLIERGDT